MTPNNIVNKSDKQGYATCYFVARGHSFSNRLICYKKQEFNILCPYNSAFQFMF